MSPLAPVTNTNGKDELDSQEQRNHSGEEPHHQHRPTDELEESDDPPK